MKYKSFPNFFYYKLRYFHREISHLKDNYIGELMFSLAYLTAAERLTIIIMKARNLIGIGNDKKTLPGSFIA